jgi:hypothetical protein
MNDALKKKAELTQQGEALIKGILDTLKSTKGNNPQAIMPLVIEFKQLLNNNMTLENIGVIHRLISDSSYIHTYWAHMVSGDMSLETGTLTFLRKIKTDEINALADILVSHIPMVKLGQLTHYAAFDECTMHKATENFLSYTSPTEISHNHGKELSRFSFYMGMTNQQNAFITISNLVNAYSKGSKHDLLVAQSQFLFGLHKEQCLSVPPDTLDEASYEFFAEHNSLLKESLKENKYPTPRSESVFTAYHYGLKEWADTVVGTYDISSLIADAETLTLLEQHDSTHAERHLVSVKNYFRLHLREAPDHNDFKKTTESLLHYFLNSKKNLLPIKDLMINQYNAPSIMELVVNMSLITDQNALRRLNRMVDINRLQAVMSEAARHMKKPLLYLAKIHDLKPILINIDAYKREILTNDMDL